MTAKTEHARAQATSRSPLQGTRRNRTFFTSLAGIVIILLAVLLVFEGVRTVISQDTISWGIHSIIIFLAALLATVAVYLTLGHLRNQEALYQKSLLNESAAREGVKEELDRSRRNLEEQSHLLDIMTGQLVDMVFYKDKNFKYIFTSKPYCERILKCTQTECAGLSDEELAERYWLTQYEQSFGKNWRGSDAYVKKTGKPIQFQETVTIGGETIWLEVDKTPIYDRKVEFAGVVGSLRDITERKLVEEELRKHRDHLEELVEARTAELQHAQKMKAIGILAGGIAHDFNNLLMGIQNRVSSIFLDVSTGHPLFTDLEAIDGMVKKGSNLTRQLLGFARGGKYEVRPTDLNDLIERITEMFCRTKKEIRVTKLFETDLWTAEVDQGQIEQVLVNLFVNSWQAMPGGGDLLLQTENVALDTSQAKTLKADAGNFVKITVADTGIGMDAETQKRIFEPFFTTKDRGSGSGLGLASAYGIVNNHGGFINVSSEKGKGATFTIYLPATESKIAGENELYGEALRGKETILIVDDESEILEVSRLLKAIGYHVLVARSGEEALQIYSQSREAIDIVILDLIMPGMSGEETYGELKKMAPQAKVLLSSGYSLTGTATAILERGGNGFIQKPFDVKHLSHRIRAILDKK